MVGKCKPRSFFDRKKEILMEEKKGVIPCEEAGKTRSRHLASQHFWGEKTHEASPVHLSRSVFLPEKGHSKKYLLIFLVIE